MAELIGRTRSWLAWLAGSVLALVFGGAGCGRDEPPVVKYGPPPRPQEAPAEKPPAPPQPTLDETVEWKALVAAWHKAMLPILLEGADVARRPDKADQLLLLEDTLAELNQGSRNVEALFKAGFLTEAEAQVLRNGLADLNARITLILDPPMLGAMCYMPAEGALARDSAARLNARLAMLRKVSEQRQVRPEVVAKALAGVEQDAKWLAEEGVLRGLSEAERVDAAYVRDASRVYAARIRNLLVAEGPAMAPEQAKSWDALLALWTETEEFLAGKRKLEPEDYSGRRQLVKRLTAAEKDLDALADGGALTQGEAGLMKRTLKEMRSRAAGLYVPPGKTPVNRYPQDSAATCVDRLSKCLPLLEKVAAQERLRPQVVNLVMAQIQLDLQRLGSRLDSIKNEAERAKTKQIHDAVNAAAQSIYKRLKESAPAAKPGQP